MLSRVGAIICVRPTLLHKRLWRRLQNRSSGLAIGVFPLSSSRSTSCPWP